MSERARRLDPEVLQARWTLGGIDPEEFVKIALSAIAQGFEGTALHQLAGLSGPTKADLGDLPTRVFAEMGLGPIGPDEAVTVLVARGEPATSPIVSALLKAFPEFSGRWKKHIVWWEGDSAGSYNDMAEFVEFTVEDLYENENFIETQRVFCVLEQLLAGADQEARNLIGLAFFETLQNFASWRPGGNAVYERFFGPISKQIWAELREMWRGKSSLAEVVRAEQKANKSGNS